jgi:hypothetical protein
VQLGTELSDWQSRLGKTLDGKTVVNEPRLEVITFHL